MKLTRTIEQHRGGDPDAMSKMSSAAIFYAFADKKADILTLHAEVERLNVQIAALTQLANAALIFIDTFAADKIDDEYSRVLINPLKAAIAAAESEAANG